MRGPTDALRTATLDLIETIVVYKLPTLTGDEIRAMLHLPETDLKKTRFYQEVFQEGLEEGREEGREKGRKEALESARQAEIARLLAQLTRRLGALTPERRAGVEALGPDALDELALALLEFASPADLDAWLDAKA